jgi:hypothetical protein
MSVEVGRRMFVGSVVTGLPLVASGGGAGLAWAQRQDGAAPVHDLVVTELQRLAKEGASKMRTRPGEGTRQIASALRLRAAHGKKENIDAQVARALRRAIQKESRQAILLRQPDAEQFRSELAAAGFPNAVLPAVDLAAREKLLNALLTTGYTGVLTALATQLEEQAEALDRNFGNAVQAAGDGFPILLRRAQTPGSEASYYCPILRSQLQHLTFLQAVWCTPLLIWNSVILLAECVFLGSAMASTYAQMYYWGCPA